MKVLGLDISSSATGFALAIDGYLDTSTIGVIVPDTKLRAGEKLVYFEKQLKKLIKRFSPDQIIIEDAFKGPNVKTFKLLCMWRGIAFKVCWEKLKKDPETIMPTSARKAVGCNVSKEEAFAWVVNKYNLSDFVFEDDNDKTDAIVLALAYFQPRPEPKPKKKRKKNAK